MLNPITVNRRFNIKTYSVMRVFSILNGVYFGIVCNYFGSFKFLFHENNTTFFYITL